MPSVDPSVSREPIADSATDLATCCVLCSHTCGVRVDVTDGKLTAVRADDNSPISNGYVCNKAFSIPAYAHHAQRVQHPMRRRPDGGFDRVTWDEAIRDIAHRLGTIRARHTGRAIGLVGVGGQANHMDAAFALSFLSGIGSQRWFNSYAQEKTQHHLMDQWMMGISPAAVLHPDTAHTNYLLVLGTNPRVTNRGHNATDTFKALARDPARTVVVVDPRATETTRGADIHLAVTPGTDYQLLLGLTACIVQNGLVDQRFLDTRTRGYERLQRHIATVDIGAMAAGCGIERTLLERVAREFAAADAASILYDLGVEQVPFSTLNSYLIRVLLAITGNLGTRGGNQYIQGINPPDPRRLERADTDTAVVSGIPGIRALGSYPMFSPSLVPEEVLCARPQRLRALIVEGSNPLLSSADTTRWREAIDALELLVVIEPAMTETARLADYVLPTPVGYEKWEVSSFPRHYPRIHTQVRPPVVAGPAEALPEAEIYARIAEAMNLFGPLPRAMRALATRVSHPRARMALLLAALPLAAGRRRTGGVRDKLVFWLYRTIGPHLPSPALTAIWLLCVKNAISRRRAVVRTLGPAWRWRDPFAIAEELFARILAHPEGVEVACLDDSDNLGAHLGTDDGRVHLTPSAMLDEIARARHAARADNSAYPFVLSAGIRTPWTANTIHRDPAWRKGKGPHCPLFVSRADAERLGVDSGAVVRLETARGAAELPVQVDKRLQAGHVAVPNGFGTIDTDGNVTGINLNALTASDDRDPFTGCPHHKHVRCRVVPATR